MADKQRELPSWMGMHKGSGFTKKVTAASAKTKKLTPRVTVYLMNEHELVQSAVGFGNSEDRICMPGFTEKVLKTEERREDGGQEGIAGPLDLQCMRTCVSEPYLDTTELETIPYGNDQRLQSGNQDCSGTLTEHPAILPHDDDALKLVREIFFK